MLSVPYLLDFGSLKGTPKLYQEAIVWKYLSHPNIVPFRGTTIIPFQLVSDWMPGGNLMEYIHKYSDANRLALVCFSAAARGKLLTPFQLFDITEGLNYLHSRHVVHGDIKGVYKLRKMPLQPAD